VRLTLRPFGEIKGELQRFCASAGVALAYVPEVKGCRACGVTRWLTASKALVQLSDRYKTEDHLWFTFFHEVGHIILHGKKAVFLEEGSSSNKEEREADRFAREQLIPTLAYESWCREIESRFTSANVLAFAEAQGVAAGIVVGRLQHDKMIPFHRLNELKGRVRV
jgi:hypothetical protein